MMKNPIVLVSLTLFTAFAQAQNITGKNEIVLDNIVATTPSADNQLPGFTTSEDAEKIISSIMEVVGLEANFKIKKAKVPNVEAAIRHRQRYILYNEEFVGLVNKMAKDKWAAIFILAHEVGHHLNGHTVRGINSRPEIELEADQFAGFALCKMGATLEQAQLAMYILAGQFQSKTHPARVERLDAIELGWNKAEAQMKNLVSLNQPESLKLSKGSNQ